MKRLALSVAIVAMATLACQRADRQGQQGDTMSDTSTMTDTMMMSDTASMMRDTAKQM